MLGPEAVVTAAVGGGRGPADRVRLVPWGDARPLPGTATDERPVWPGHVPSPAPATVHRAPPSAEVVDAIGAAVTVTGRGSASADPARLSIDGGPWADITAWAGPWPVDEHWWTAAPRRRARWQVITTDGRAHLLALEGGRWLVEATYD